jgi:Zn-dependent peptidase ImmA (M78 family)
MKRQRERYITDLAENVADKYFASFKVDPVLIASQEGISMCDGSYADYFEAMIEYCAAETDHPFHIYLNNDMVKSRNSLRARSTLGHELGHYFIPEHKALLMKGESLNYDCDWNYVENPSIEREAQTFSANLLMPQTKFANQASHFTPGLNSILNLSYLFDTSKISTALQYLKVDLLPGVLIQWGADNKFQWKYVSPSFQKKIRNSYNFQFNPVRPTTEYELHNIKFAGSTCVYGTAVTNLSSWVYDIRPGTPLDIPLYEESMSLGKYGGISLLYLTS